MFRNLLLLMLVFPQIAFAKIEISDTGRNLGIGTTSVKNALSVRSTLAVGSSTYTDTTAPTNGAIFEGNVGMGKLTASSALDVNGTVTATAFVGDGSGLTGISSDSGGGGWDDDGTVLHLTTSTDNVGVGTISPVSKLDVNGEITASKINSVIVVDGVRYAKTSTGIQAAHDALGPSGGEISLPAGDYSITGNINITKDQVTIKGVGKATYLRLANGTNTRIFTVSGDDFTLMNTYVDANKANNSTTNSMILVSDGADRAKFISNYLTDATSRCISAKEVTGLVITLNEFYLCGNQTAASEGAFGTEGAIGTRIVNNRFLSTRGAAIYLATGTTTSRTADQTIIKDNWFSDTNQDSGLGGVSSVHWSGGKSEKIIVSNNVFTNHSETTHGINAVNIGSTSKDVQFVITNNIMDQVTGVGIETHGGHGIISGNYITNVGSCATCSDQSAMYISSTPNETIISNNYVAGGKKGILLVADSSQDATNIIVTGNIIKNIQGSSGLLLVSDTGRTLSNITISNNSIFDDQGSPTQLYGINKSGSGTLTNINLSNNTFYGNATGNINPSIISELNIFSMKNKNIGIGTTLPSANLDILGTLKVSSNVGIATSNPGTALDVTGTVRATAFSGDGSGLTGVGASSGWTTDSSTKTATTYNVGIGSVNPTVALDINGTAKATAFQASSSSAGFLDLFEANANGSNKFTLTSPSSLTSNRTCTIEDDSTPLDGCISATSGGWTDGGTTVYTTTATDNVGIGTFSANALLDISSTAAQDLFRVNDNGTAETSPFVISSIGNVGVGTFATDRGIFTIRQQADTSNTQGLVILNSGLGISNRIWADASNNSRWDSGTGGTGAILINGNGGTSAGNIGLGTFTTNGLVDISSKASKNMFIVNDDGAGDATPFVIDSTGNIGIGTTTATNGKLIVASGNIGLGSLVPGEVLDVTGTVRATAFSGNGSGQALFGSNAGIGFDGVNLSASTPMLTISSNGNIGINSTSPGVMLDVGGVIRLNGTGSGAFRIQAAGNQACTTTCTTGKALVGLDQGTLGVVLPSLVGPSDTTADQCLCGS